MRFVKWQLADLGVQWRSDNKSVSGRVNYLADVSRCFPSPCGFWRCSWSRRGTKALVACGREAGSHCPSANRGARREVWPATGPPTPDWLIQEEGKNTICKFRKTSWGLLWMEHVKDSWSNLNVLYEKLFFDECRVYVCVCKWEYSMWWPVCVV